MFEERPRVDVPSLLNHSRRDQKDGPKIGIRQKLGQLMRFLSPEQCRGVEHRSEYQALSLG